MAFGALLAVLIAQSFGKSTQTDAFFAAYGVYTVGLVFSGTFRLTAVSRLVQADGPEVSTQLLVAVALLALVAAVPMVVLAGPVAHALVANDPDGVAGTALRVLWVALAGQLGAAMLATMLTVRGAFTALGIVTLLMGFVTIGTFFVVRGPAGIQAASVGLAAGAVWLSGSSWLVLRHTGWRAARPSSVLLRGTLWETRRLGYASLTFIGTNLAYVVSLAIVTRHGEGEGTLYSYAYVLAGMLVAITANVSAMVRSPSLVASPDRTRETAAVGVWSLRFTVVVGVPALGLALIAGPPLIGAALGSGFSHDDIRAILVMLPCFIGWVLASASGIFAIVELLARDDLRRLGWLALAQVVGAGVLGVVGGVVAGGPGVAVALSVVALAVAFTQMEWAFGERSGAAGLRMLRDLSRGAVVFVVSFGPPALLLWLGGTSYADYAVATLLAIILVVPVSLRLWPQEAGSIVGLLRR